MSRPRLGRMVCIDVNGRTRTETVTLDLTNAPDEAATEASPVSVDPPLFPPML